MKIGVLYGGWSSEREVSLKSGKRVAAALREKGYDIVEYDVDRNIATKLSSSPIDIAFLILHGKPGEDGTIQGMLETLNIPYTGSGVLASALCMNKILTKTVLASQGLPTPSYQSLKKGEKPSLEPPYVVKPVAEGSSVGVTIVHDQAEYQKAVAEAEEFGNFFVEDYIDGMEITVGILGDRALPILELVPKNEFYNYEAKYTDGMTEFILPARINKEKTKQIKKIALDTHRALGCRDFSRVDFVFDGQQSYVLEVNTIPGMTELSDVPAEAEEIGISYNDLVERILHLALKRNK